MAGLSTDELQTIREQLAAGRKPRVQFTEGAGQMAGQLHPRGREHREQDDLGAQPDQQPQNAGGKRPLRSPEQVEHTGRSGPATVTAAPERTGTRRSAAGHDVPSPQGWNEWWIRQKVAVD